MVAYATTTGDSGSGRSDVADTDSAEAKAAIAALENDDTSWDDGDEVESKFERPEKKSKAATDDVDEDLEESDDDVESADDSDDAEEDSEDEADDSENDQADADKNDVAKDAIATDIEAERKKHNDEMARMRIEERKTREALETARAERTEATIEQYIQDAGDDEIEQERRKLNVENFRQQEERIQITTDRLEVAVERAMTSTDLFRTGSTAVKEELANAFEEFEQRFIETDKAGRPLKVKIDPSTGKPADLVAFIKRKADSIKRLQGEGRSQQDKSKKKEQARSLTPPVRAPKTSKKDSDLDGFDEEARK